LKKMSDGLSCDIDHLHHEQDTKNGVNASLRDDLKRLEVTLHDEVLNNAEMRKEFCCAQDCFKSKEGEYHHLRNVLSGLEKKQNDLTNMLADRDCEYYERVKKLDDLDKEVAHLNIVLNNTCKDNDNLDHQLQHQIKQNTDLMKANSCEDGQNKDHSGHTLGLEAQLRDKDAHLHVLYNDADCLKASLEGSQARKNELSEELYALNKHISVITDQNNRLSYELNDITERDAQIRAALDRRHRVKDLTAANDSQMRESMHNINEVRSRSP
jgi:chromosome segregation ATPase